MKINFSLRRPARNSFRRTLTLLSAAAIACAACEPAGDSTRPDAWQAGAPAGSRATARKDNPPLRPGANPVTFKSEGATLVGTLFLPPSYQPGQKLAAVLVDGPWTQVKEQVGYRYGRLLAEAGFAALALDHRFWGRSGGSPRNYESTAEKAEDLQSALAFLEKTPAIDKRRLGVLGVCAGAGITARVVGQDDRVKSYATVAAWLQHPSTTPLFYEGPQGVQRRIRLSEAAREKFEQTGQVDYVAAYDPAPGSGAAMFFPVDYYANPDRGAIPQWENRFAVMGWQEWLELNAIDGVAEKITVPTLMVHSDSSALPGNVRRFYGLLKGPKELVWTEGEHTQFYDQDPYVPAAVDALRKHFARTLVSTATEAR
jgi:hypothetical protein